MVFRKLISLLLLFTILFAVSSPVFASSDAVRYSASAYYPRPSADEFSGYVSFIDSDNNLYTYCWRFFPYEGLVETSNVSPRMDVYYNSSDGKLYFNGYTGLSEQTSIVIYRYYSSSSSTSPSVTLMLSDSFTISREYAVSSVAPVAVSFGGNVDYGFVNSSYYALNITFSEDSNTDYNVELFYNYYKNMMDMLYPAITAAFADINNIDLSVDNIETYSSQINSKVTSIINLLTTELVGSGDGSLQNPYTIRDLLVQIANNTGSEYSSADLDSIEASLSTVSDFLSKYTLSFYRDVSNRLDSLELFSSYFYDFFTCDYTYFDFASLLESVASTVSSDFYSDYLEAHFTRQEEFYSNVEDFLQAYIAFQAVDSRLDYDTNEHDSITVFGVLYNYIFKPVKDIWSDFSLIFKTDNSSQSVSETISSTLFNLSPENDLYYLDLYYLSPGGLP